MTLTQLIKAIIFAGAILLVCGCQNQAGSAPGAHGDNFAPEEAATDEGRLLEAQEASGAAYDPTLYASHFSGSDLNSLGKAKLDWMLRANGEGPMAVWIDLPDDDQAAQRRMSVAAYLKDHGFPPEEIAFGRGPNPNTGSPAAKGLKDLINLDAPSAGSSSSSSSGGSLGAAAGGAAPGTP